MVISRSDLEELAGRASQPESPVLSIYLDVDQSKPANRNKGYLAALKDRLRALERQVTGGAAAPSTAGGAAPARAADAREYARDAQRVLDFVAGLEAHGRTLALFCDASADFLWSRELRVSLGACACWEEKPHVRPLAEALDEYERFGVVLANRERARVFVVALGEIEEDRGVSAPEKIKEIASPGNDYILSQDNLQRREDEHALWHLKQVAEELDRRQAKHRFDRLILAGPQEITRELQGILPKRLRGLVVRCIALPVEASEQTVLNETLRIEQEVERAAELELVEELLTRAGKGARGAISIEPTLDAMRLGRILKLVYVDGYAPAGVECVNCRSLFLDGVSACAYCGSGVRPAPDVVARLVSMVVDSGGRAEVVRGAAAERLKNAGSIGAFLRF
jgi:hypothetical protein